MIVGVVSLLALVAIGCAGQQTVRELPVAVTVQTDKVAYDIGEPVIVTVRVQNAGKNALILPRLDGEALRFRMTMQGENPVIERQPVESKEVRPELREVLPGQSTERKFLFTRLTMEEGQFVVSVTLKGMVIDKQAVEDAVFSKPAAYAVSGKVALRRDVANGMILKEQALELARGLYLAQNSVSKCKEEIVLMPLGQSGLFNWVVVFTTGAAGKEDAQWFEVNPYTGKTQRVEGKK